MRACLIVAVAIIVAALLSACAIQRAQVASDARAQMVGLTKEQVLACMGPPASKAAEAATEIWSYNSGDGTTISSGEATGRHVFDVSTINPTSISGVSTIDTTSISRRRF